jgi:hypothetical protein
MGVVPFGHIHLSIGGKSKTLCSSIEIIDWTCLSTAYRLGFLLVVPVPLLATFPRAQLQTENKPGCTIHGGEPMGANPTQAVALTLMLIAFVLLAGAFAGGGIIMVLGTIVFGGASCFFFAKCKPWEHQDQ